MLSSNDLFVNDQVQYLTGCFSLCQNLSGGKKKLRPHHCILFMLMFFNDSIIYDMSPICVVKTVMRTLPKELETVFM